MWSERREKWGAPAVERGNILASSPTGGTHAKFHPKNAVVFIVVILLFVFAIAVVVVVVGVLYNWWHQRKAYPKFPVLLYYFGRCCCCCCCCCCFCCWCPWQERKHYLWHPHQLDPYMHPYKVSPKFPDGVKKLHDKMKVGGQPLFSALLPGIPRWWRS